jgi:5-methyltetrahydrofolate--homocysteine methyltransferase
MLKDAMRERILLLDGAMGTQLLARGGKAPLELLNVEQADVVGGVHRAYLEAGADVITTNTLCCDSLSLAEYGLSERSYDIALAGARVARAAADDLSLTKPRYVVGSLGPTTRNLTLSTDVGADAVAEAYRTVIRGLIDGGVDAILVESAMDIKNIRLAVEQVRAVSADIPIFVSAVLSRIVGRVASGATVEKFLEQLPLDDITAVGFNCTASAANISASVATLCDKSKRATILYPSCDRHSSVKDFTSMLEPLMREHKLNIVGGCCGTTPEHIKALRKVVDRWQPRRANI